MSMAVAVAVFPLASRPRTHRLSVAVGGNCQLTGSSGSFCFRYVTNDFLRRNLACIDISREIVVSESHHFGLFKSHLAKLIIDCLSLMLDGVT